MRPIVTVIAWSVWLQCLCLLVASVSYAKTDEPIKMSFGMWTQGDLRTVCPVAGTLRMSIGVVSGGDWGGLAPLSMDNIFFKTPSVIITGTRTACQISDDIFVFHRLGIIV